jgi:hypothetical protein
MITMANSRDDFTQRTKTDLALRVSYLCSNCKQSTVDPSDERPDGVTMVGVAAHICAAAPGAGARRYDASMTREERSHIDNGIWLCSTCSVLIDRDEERFSVEALRQMKREHEDSRRIGGGTREAEGNIIAVGPSIVAVGHIIASRRDGMRVRLSHFVEGSSRDVLSFVHDFDRLPREKRYILMNELGYSGLLAEVPDVERVDGAYELRFQMQERAPRRNATENIGAFAHELVVCFAGLMSIFKILNAP